MWQTKLEQQTFIGVHNIEQKAHKDIVSSIWPEFQQDVTNRLKSIIQNVID